MTYSRIAGTGRYLPERIMTNFDLEKMFETSDEWIQQRSGIVERRYADEGVYCSDLALEATQRALDDAKMKAEDLDFIILATLSPDHHFPGAERFGDVIVRSQLKPLNAVVFLPFSG